MISGLKFHPAALLQFCVKKSHSDSAIDIFLTSVHDSGAFGVEVFTLSDRSFLGPKNQTTDELFP